MVADIAEQNLRKSALDLRISAFKKGFSALTKIGDEDSEIN